MIQGRTVRNLYHPMERGGHMDIDWRLIEAKTDERVHVVGIALPEDRMGGRKTVEYSELIMPPRFLVLMVTLLLLPGCNDFLAKQMVAPPNGHSPERASVKKDVDASSNAGGEMELHVAVGEPRATLAVWILSPRGVLPVRGTILALHGFLNDHHQVEPAAHALADAGYRVVMVDLRGHGESTGDYITYGVRDAQDLAELATHLQSMGLCGDSVGVFGTSYGAGTALLLAGSDSRVKAVVAVAPFTTLRQEAPYFGKHLMPIPGLIMSDADYAYVIDRMGHLASFDPDLCSPIAAMHQTAAHVRLFHGDADMIIPSQSSRDIAAAAPGQTQLTVVHGLGHLALVFDPLGTLHSPTREWFDRYLAGNLAN